MSNESSKMITFSCRLPQEVDRQVHSHLTAANCQSKNEYITKAIRWYTAYLDNGQNEEFLGQSLYKMFEDLITPQITRLNRTIFKEAVTMSVLTRFVATLSGTSDTDMDELYKRALRDVREIHGSLNLDKALADERLRRMGEDY